MTGTVTAPLFMLMLALNFRKGQRPPDNKTSMAMINAARLSEKKTIKYKQSLNQNLNMKRIISAYGSFHTSYFKEIATIK